MHCSSLPLHPALVAVSVMHIVVECEAHRRGVGYYGAAAAVAAACLRNIINLYCDVARC